MLGNVSCFSCRLLTFFKINLFKNSFECQKILIKIRTDIWSKLFGSVDSRQKKSLQAEKELLWIHCVVEKNVDSDPLALGQNFLY